MVDKKIVKVLITTGSKEDWLGDNAFKIKAEKVYEDGTVSCIAELGFVDGEPEDNSLCRNFNNVYSISSMLTKVAEAAQGVPIEEVDVELTEDFEWEEGGEEGEAE